MKKYTLLCIGLCTAMAFTGCKSSESAYKKAYEKAKQYDTANQQATSGYEEPATVVPVEAKPATDSRVVDNLENVSGQGETLISGSGLKAYSVVVGSYVVRATADALQQRLRDAGYDAQIVKNEANNMFRVVAATFDNRDDAAYSRDQLRAGGYKDAWLLYNAR